MGKVDARNISFNFIEKDKDMLYDYCELQVFFSGVQVGQMDFRVDHDDSYLIIGRFDIKPEYRNMGIGQLFYKELGRIHGQNYPGHAISRTFENPIAEYSFRKAVSLGWIDDSTLDEGNIDRITNKERKELWTDLRQKLPEQYRGPEVWAKSKRLLRQRR